MTSEIAKAPVSRSRHVWLMSHILVYYGMFAVALIVPMGMTDPEYASNVGMASLLIFNHLYWWIVTLEFEGGLVIAILTGFSYAYIWRAMPQLVEGALTVGAVGGLLAQVLIILCIFDSVYHRT